MNAEINTHTKLKSWFDIIAIVFILIFVLIVPLEVLVSRKSEIETFIDSFATPNKVKRQY